VSFSLLAGCGLCDSAIHLQGRSFTQLSSRVFEMRLANPFILGLCDGSSYAEVFFVFAKFFILLPIFHFLLSVC
jgi:ABC-type Fe3+-siderophore transport system permease subunit